MELRLHQRLEAVCGAEGLVTAAFCSQGDALAVGSRDGVLGLWTALPGLPQLTVKEAAARSGLRNKTSSFGEDFQYIHRPLAKPMMHVTPNGVRNLSQTADERKSLQNSEWFVRSDLRSLSGTASVFDRSKKTMKYADRERGNKPSPVTPNIRAKLMAASGGAGLARRKSLTHDGGDFGDDGDETLQKSSSTPELKRWKPTGHEAVFQDVLSEYCNATGLPCSMSKTLPNMSDLGAKSNAFNSTCWGADSDSTPNTPTPASMRTSVIKHAAQGVVKRITLDAQSIC